MSEFLPLVVIAAVALLLRRVKPSLDVVTIAAPLEGRAAPFIVGVLSALVTWWMWGSLSATPYVHDEVALLLQARIFAAFRWASPSPPLPEFFEQFHVFVTPSLAPKYPPGHALLMVPGVWLGIPGLLSVVLTGVTGGMLFLLARRFSNGAVALVAWAIWLVAPAALRFRASYFSEMTTGAIWLVAWWTLLRLHDRAVADCRDPPDHRVVQHDHVHACPQEAIEGLRRGLDDRFVLVKARVENHRNARLLFKR